MKTNNVSILLAILITGAIAGLTNIVLSTAKMQLNNDVSTTVAATSTKSSNDQLCT
jgi:hypothetical protein